MKTLYLLLLIPIISYSQYNINIDGGIIDYPEPGPAATYSLGVSKIFDNNWGASLDYQFTEIPQDQFYSLQALLLYELDDDWANVQIGAGVSRVFKYNDLPAVFMVRYNVKLNEYLYISPMIRHMFGGLVYQNTYLTIGFQFKVL
jgi:hypothetical protein